MGELREILILFETAIVFFSWEIGMFFYYKYYNNRKSGGTTSVNLDWGILFSAFGFTLFFYQISDFYFMYRPLFSFLGYISIATGIFLFSFHLEKIGIYNTKYILPIFSLGVVVALIISFLVDPTFPKNITNVSVIPLISIIIFYIFQLFRNLKGKFKLYSLGLFIGFILLSIGHMGSSDVSIEWFGIYIRLISDIIMLIGICFVAGFFNALPSLAEIDWYDKLNYIFVIEKSGICLYNEKYKDRKAIENKAVLAASLLNIQNFLDSMMKEYKRVKTIEKEDEFFLIEYGNYVTCVLITTEPLESLKYLLKKFVIEFEDFFSDVLKTWNGNIRLFNPTSQLISKIFKKIQ